LAPERFVDEYSRKLRRYENLEKPMDVFSAGCVIAEILMDGKTLFDLARL
jgi:hypothetical protein